ncbi:hypothetical protein H5T51_07225 [Candidatus Bathyarchaeota archaeon]|nr:hypothetical protein [Candidatus Bathyarchaeota archaeon]
MDKEVLKVTLVENKGGGSEKTDLQRLENLAVKLIDLDHQIKDCRVELEETQAELEEFKRKSAIEKRFCELTGLPFTDKSGELENKVKKLKERLESLSTERTNIYKDILKGLTEVIVPIQGDEPSAVSEDEVFFTFRENKQFPAITQFIRKELKFGIPPVYVSIQPEGIRVVGVNDKVKALEELVNAIEELRKKAKQEAGSTDVQRTTIEPPNDELKKEDELIPKNVLQSLKKFGKR